MTDAERVAELLSRWRQRAEHGHEVTIQSLCAEYPHLAGPLAEAVRKLKATASQDGCVSGAATLAKPVPVAGPYAPSPLAGRYQLTRRIGSGGHGDVWLAFDHALGRDVAVKLPRDLGPEAGESLLAGAKRVARLRHRGIAQVHVADRDRQRYFIVSEHMSGGSLADRVARVRLEVIESVRTARQVADALAYAHREGVVHRNLKPSNVLLDRDGRLCLCDFGEALTLPQTLPTAPQRRAAAYLSPEQVRGNSLDGRSDVYAVGVLLYELLTGQTPFAANTMAELCDQILHRNPPPTTRNLLVPVALDRLVTRCLEKMPSDRYEDAEQLADALRHFEADATAPPSTIVGEPHGETVPVPMGTDERKYRARLGGLQGPELTPLERVDGYPRYDAPPPPRPPTATSVAGFAVAALVWLSVIGPTFYFEAKERAKYQREIEKTPLAQRKMVEADEGSFLCCCAPFAVAAVLLGGAWSQAIRNYQT